MDRLRHRPAGGGLALRSRGLFYTAYGLFAVTAFKVVMIDLATMPTLYRMLSFLALGVLLLAGAWLNLRFRERLVSPGSGRVRVLAVLLLAVPAVAAAAAARGPTGVAPAFERVVEVPGPGLFAVRLDRHVYEAARAGPRGPEESSTARGRRFPTSSIGGWVAPAREASADAATAGPPTRSATVVLDFGERLAEGPARPADSPARTSGAG